MKIFIYVTGQPKGLIKTLINRLDKAGVGFFIDKHVPTRDWYKANLEGNCRVFNNRWKCYDKDYPKLFVPFLLCVAEHDENPDWAQVLLQLRGDGTSELTTSKVQHKSLKRGPDIERLEPDIKKVKDTAHYDLETYIDKDHDTMFYQMTRAHEERSWTSVTKDFTKRGHTPFFSSFFYLQSFGSGHDIDFLTHCWQAWDMPGRMEIEQLVKEHIDQAEKDETLCPRVYQNQIRPLIHLFNVNQWP